MPCGPVRAVRTAFSSQRHGQGKDGVSLRYSERRLVRMGCGAAGRGSLRWTALRSVSASRVPRGRAGVRCCSGNARWRRTRSWEYAREGESRRSAAFVNVMVMTCTV